MELRDVALWIRVDVYITEVLPFDGNIAFFLTQVYFFLKGLPYRTWIKQINEYLENPRPHFLGTFFTLNKDKCY